MHQQQHPQMAASVPPTDAGTSASTTAAAAATATSNSMQENSPHHSSSSKKDYLVKEPSDEAVMNYLRQRGMASAVLELNKILKRQQQKDFSKEPSTRESMELEESEARVQRGLLARSTGGGIGYDADAGPSIAQWAVPDPHVDPKLLKDNRMGTSEAKSFVDAFVAVQTWVLSLPDQPQPSTFPKKAAKTTPNTSHKHSTAKNLLVPKTGISLASVVKKQPGHHTVPENLQKDLETLDKVDEEDYDDENMYSGLRLPPSVKPELLAVTFALLVYTHCELLEVGMESTAASVLHTFRSIYEPTYTKELSDLDRCKTTEDVVRLNAHNTQHLECLGKLKAIMVRVADYQLKKDELSHDAAKSSNSSNANYLAARNRRLAEYDKHIDLWQQKYDEVAKSATSAFNKMQDLPFLRRAKAVRWQLTLSAPSYALLASYLSSREALLPMNTILLKQCEISVEKRDPLPYIPACVLDDNSVPSRKRARLEVDINWAAPASKTIHEKESPGMVDKLPFPPLHLEKEYGSEREAEKAKRKVEFNRALLMNGFRRLEALERRLEYDSGLRRVENKPPQEEEEEEGPDNDAVDVVNPLEPSVLLATLCSSSSAGPHLAMGRSVDASAIWEESGVGLTCAKMSPPDGRRVAAGCDDAAVRIWSIYGGNEEVHEAGIVLLGHKNGFPVFDVDWNRDGRTLLSAGGDGSIRLWDTLAKGPFGTVATVTRRTAPQSKPEPVSEEGPGMTVPGLRDEATDDIAGAALAVYRGHAPSCPVWSVSFAPSGYYFASAASDGTGRIFTTDRPAPVRILSGHTSASVNCVRWHPNCNYVVTGCDDKTVRMWDVQSGRCVRLLNGCGHGINTVAVSPSGKYLAGADCSGVVHLWELGSGQKMNELRTTTHSNLLGSSLVIHSMSFSSCGTSLAVGGDDCTVRIWDVRGAGNHMGNPHYAKQQGWGSGNATTAKTPPVNDHKKRPGMLKPHKVLQTRRTILLDLNYTKRNLLLTVGKYTTPVPLVTPIAD